MPNEVIVDITEQKGNVLVVKFSIQLDGPCPICGTGRNQYGECHQGHIVLERAKTHELTQRDQFLREHFGNEK